MTHATLASRLGRALGAITLLSAPACWAHEGHGMPGLSHWHATDAIVWVIIAAVVAAAIWSGKDGQ